MSEEEKLEEENSKEAFNQMCLWLNKIEKSYRIENWGSGEGRDIILEINHEDNHIGSSRTKELRMSFFHSGYIDFEYNDEEKKKKDKEEEENLEVQNG